MSNETTQLICEATNEAMTDFTSASMLPMTGFLLFFSTPLVFAAMVSSIQQ